MTSNIADISAFESLQNQANVAMGYQPVSVNSVFNTVVYKEIRKPTTPEEEKKIKALKGEAEKLEKEYLSKVSPMLTQAKKLAAQSDELKAEAIKLDAEVQDKKKKCDAALNGASQSINEAVQLGNDVDKIKQQTQSKMAPIASELGKLGVDIRGWGV